MIHNTNTTTSRLNWGTNRIPQSKRLLRSAQPQWTDDREWWSTLWEIPEIDQLMSSATIEQTRPQLPLQLLHSTRLDRLQTMKKCHPQFLPTMNLPWLSHHLQITQVRYLLEGRFISKSYFIIDILTFLLGGMRFSRINFQCMQLFNFANFYSRRDWGYDFEQISSIKMITWMHKISKQNIVERVSFTCAIPFVHFRRLRGQKTSGLWSRK